MSSTDENTEKPRQYCTRSSVQLGSKRRLMPSDIVVEPIEPTAKKSRGFSINPFATPWNNSDIILVVDGVDLHVHRSILKLQSPVFERMFNGNFNEATKEKITLPGKDADDMIAFLNLLYPRNMVKARVLDNPLTWESVVKILPLADEYQADNVMKECFEEIKITHENACRVLHYADKYNQFNSWIKCIDIITRYVPTSTVADELDDIEISGSADPSLARSILEPKCEHLESISVRGLDVTEKLLAQLVIRTNGLRSTVHLPGCGHTISAGCFHKAKGCKNCMRGYLSSFISKVLVGSPGMDKKVYNLLMDMYKITHYK